MKIKSLQAYNPVIFDKTNTKFFTILPIPSQVRVSNIEWVPEYSAWKITNEKDSVLIPISNVIAIYPWNEEDTAKVNAIEDAKKAKPNSVPHNEIKRPK